MRVWMAALGVAGLALLLDRTGTVNDEPAPSAVAGSATLCARVAELERRVEVLEKAAHSAATPQIQRENEP